jgi:hypothetical protein
VVLGKEGIELDVIMVALDKGIASGFIMDMRTKAFLQGATVDLLIQGKDDPVLSATTDDEGAFSIASIDNGDYVLEVSLSGYITGSSDPFEITDTIKENIQTIELTRMNNKPVLSMGSFSPKSGKDSDKYSFEVTYTDADGDSPDGNGVVVMVGDRKLTMDPPLGEKDFEDGVKYSISDISLDDGDYRIIFMTTDYQGAPADPLSLEENLEVKKDESAAAKTSLLVVAAVVVILIVLTIIAITVLLFRKKAKKDAEDLEEVTTEVDTKVSELMCTGCGSVLPEGTVKCPKCGRDLKKIEAQHEKEFKCPTCGAANPVGTKKCSACEKDFTAAVKDTTRLAGEASDAEGVEADAAQAEMDAAWQEPVDAGSGLIEDEEEPAVEEEPPEGEDLTDEDFDDGLSFEGFDDL